MEALCRGVLDGAVHPLDLAVRPGVVGLGQTVLDPIGFADHVEAHRPGVDGVPIPRLFCELDPVVRQDGVDLVRHCFEHVLQELPSRLSVNCRNKLGDGELGRPVDTHEEKELSLGGLHLSDVDMKEPNQIALELLALGFVSLDTGKTRDAVPLQAPMQRRPCQVRDRGLQGIEAIIQRQQRVPSEGDDCRLFFLGLNRRSRFLRPGLGILDRHPLAPLSDRLGVDAQLPAQLRERR